MCLSSLLSLSMRVVSFSVFVVASNALHPNVGEHSWGWNLEAAATAHHFTQKVDHFGDNDKTWKQAYFVNDEHWAGPNSDAPVLLYIGGEGSLGGSSVTDNFIVDWLPKTKGLLLAVEHRYYGCHNPASCPYDVRQPAKDHLKYLSSRQALADLATFHAFASDKFGLSTSTKWLAFGGSYPGMLAAYVRAVYPDLIFAAVASSAPVKAKLDTTEFQEVIARAYALDVEGVRGSSACREAIAEGHAAVGHLLTSQDGREQLATMFPRSAKSGTWLEDPTNQRVFAGCGVASFPAQGNNPLCTREACGISQICGIMGDASFGSAIERLAKVASVQSSVDACDMDWEDGDDPPKATNFWGYQTCTEFGFYQTCEKGTECFYTQGLVSFNSPFHKPNEFCLSQFNITTEQTVQFINETVSYYDAKIAATSRIIWVNGDVDPWSGLSHHTPPGEDQPAIYPVSGARHHAWQSAARDSDQQSVKDARTKIYGQLLDWLRASQTVV